MNALMDAYKKRALGYLGPKYPGLNLKKIFETDQSETVMDLHDKLDRLSNEK